MSYLMYLIGNEQQHNKVIVCVTTLLIGCDRPKSSMLHSCIFPVAKYVNVVNVVITSISGATALMCSVGDVSNKISHKLTVMHCV